MTSLKVFTWQTWVKVVIGLALAVFGVLTQFNVVINEAPAEPKIVRVADGDLVKHDGMMSRETCQGLRKHRGEAKRHFLDSYGIPKDHESSLGLYYPLRGTSGYQTCDLRFDFDDKLSGVEMTLWSDE